MSKNLPYIKEAGTLAQTVHDRTESCFICNRLDNAMERYRRTILAMWNDEEGFRKLFNESKGFCIEHFSQMLITAENHLMGKKQREFMAELITLEKSNLARIEQELEWYTLKFDYRNKDKPWNNSKDAVERTLSKLRSWRKPE